MSCVLAGCHLSTSNDNLLECQPVSVVKMSGESPLKRRGCPGDILLLIFEEVHRTAPASLRDLRLASRQFNVLVHPIIYRHVKLNNTLVKCFEVDDEPKIPLEVMDVRRRVRSAICTFTRQITVKEVLNWESVVTLLLSLKNLNHLHWSFWTMEEPHAHWPVRIPQIVLDGLAERWPSAQVSVDNLRFDSSLAISSLPATRLVSFDMQRPSHQVGPTLKNTLLKCNQLKVLHLLDVRSECRFIDEDIEQSERLPAVEELFLQGYLWLHSPSVATNFWSWSRLTCLRLKKVFIVNFLETVSPKNLTQLRFFITDGHCQSAVDHTKVSVLHMIYPRLVPISKTTRLYLIALTPIQFRSACCNSRTDCCRLLLL